MSKKSSVYFSVFLITSYDRFSDLFDELLVLCFTCNKHFSFSRIIFRKFFGLDNGQTASFFCKSHLMGVHNLFFSEIKNALESTALHFYGIEENKEKCKFTNYFLLLKYKISYWNNYSNIKIFRKKNSSKLFIKKFRLFYIKIIKLTIFKFSTFENIRFFTSTRNWIQHHYIHLTTH